MSGSQPVTTTDSPELPSLDPGVHLLGTDPRTAGALPALVVDHVLCEGGTACWVDANGRARTDPLVRLAPGPRILDRIQVARGFTPWQHYALVQALPDQVDDRTALVVLPAVDRPYRDDKLRDDGTDMLVRVLARVAGLARRRDLTVLLTRSRDDQFTEPIVAASERIRCEQTPMGPRFVTDDFETLVYPRRDGTVQTTLAFWQQVLTARAQQAQLGRPTAGLGGETLSDQQSREGTTLKTTTPPPGFAPGGATPRSREVVPRGTH